MVMQLLSTKLNDYFGPFHVTKSNKYKHMKKLWILILMSTACSSGVRQDDPQAETKIRAVMAFQQDAWNEGDIDKFMEGYWKSDSLQFIGSGIRKGWQATLEGYKKSYPTREAMGTLAFEIWQIIKLSEDAYLLTGKYTLHRANDQPSGPFTLIFRKKNNKWVVVYDHTS